MRRLLVGLAAAAAIILTGGPALADTPDPGAGDALAACEFQASWSPGCPAWTVSVAQQNAQLARTGGHAYIVVRHDNLWRIAVRLCGSGRQWKAIRKANHIHGTRIDVGQVLTIPCSRHPK